MVRTIIANVVKTMPCLPSPSHHHFYRWYKLTIPSHGWFMIVFTTDGLNNQETPSLIKSMAGPLGSPRNHRRAAPVRSGLMSPGFEPRMCQKNIEHG